MRCLGVLDPDKLCLSAGVLNADLSGRPDLPTARVALDPSTTAIVDLNSATVEGTDGNRLTLGDILRDDGAYFLHVIEATSLIAVQATVDGV